MILSTVNLLNFLRFFFKYSLLGGDEQPGLAAAPAHQQRRRPRPLSPLRGRQRGILHTAQHRHVNGVKYIEK